MGEAARFWAKVDKRGADECWPWTAALGKPPRHYGRFRQPTGHEYAHRVAWRLTNGPIPEGAKVLHGCDNPPCCNPGHLRLGSQTENNLDAVARGRYGYRGIPGNQNAKKKPGEGTRPYARR